MLLLPILLGLLALAILTIRGLYARERTPLPATAGVLASAALIVGLVRLYQAGAEADERGTSEIDSLTTVLVLGGIAALAALAVRLRYVIARHCATTQGRPPRAPGPRRRCGL